MTFNCDCEKDILKDLIASNVGKPHMEISPGFASTILNLTKEFWLPSFPSKRSLLNAWSMTDFPLEHFLVSASGVPRIELVHRIIEQKDAYGFLLSNEYVEFGINHKVPQETSAKLGLLPLCINDDRLYCLVDENSLKLKPGQVIKHDALSIVPLGVVGDFEDQLNQLYRGLEKHDTSNRRLGEYLVHLGMLNNQQLFEALQVQQACGERLGMVLVRLGYVSELIFYEALAALLELPFYRTTNDLVKLVDFDFARQLPRVYCERNMLVVLRREEDTLWVATDDPNILDQLQSISMVFHTKKSHVGVASPSSLRNAIISIYGDVGGPFTMQSPVVDEIRKEISVEETPEISAGIPKFLNYIMYESIRQRCSDIHIERYEDRVDIKLRTDGHLRKMPDSRFISVSNVQSLLAKIKVDAKLDIAEQRRPQDGVIRKHIDGQIVDFRVAIVPTLWGENAVLRILNQSHQMPKLDELGLSPGKLASFRRLIQNPEGYILMTGPTGSGKTTTLYAILQELLPTGRKIVTVEDPIEYAIAGIQQSQADEAIGNTFDKYLRSFMRCDPDVILIGEIRDPETAQMATRAALTGHLVFSTLHVNDSISTVRRLIDLGVEANLVSQTLLGVISQRLARKVCNRCAQSYKPAPDLVDEFFPDGVPAGVNFTRGTGCPACNHSGYSGRLALVEFWAPDNDERVLIDAVADAQSLRLAAVEHGMEMLAANAIDKVKKGHTTLEEIRKIVPFTQIVNYRRTMRDAGLVKSRSGLIPHSSLRKK